LAVKEYHYGKGKPGEPSIIEAIRAENAGLDVPSLVFLSHLDFNIKRFYSLNYSMGHTQFQY